MSTEIKAKGDSLVEKFRKVGIRSTDEIELHSAIQSSIIAVEEIIKTYPSVWTHEQNPTRFWNGVLNYLKSKQ